MQDIKCHVWLYSKPYKKFIILSYNIMLTYCFFVSSSWSLEEKQSVFCFPSSYQSAEPDALPISALEEQGLDELKRAVEGEIVNSTGKHILDLKVNLSTPQLRCELFILTVFSCLEQQSIRSKCVSPSTVGCTKRPPFRTWRWMQMRARLSSRSSSATLPTDATRNCSQADSKAGRRAIFPPSGQQLRINYWSMWIKKLQTVPQMFFAVVFF